MAWRVRAVRGGGGGWEGGEEGGGEGGRKRGRTRGRCCCCCCCWGCWGWGGMPSASPSSSSHGRFLAEVREEGRDDEPPGWRLVYDSLLVRKLADRSSRPGLAWALAWALAGPAGPGPCGGPADALEDGGAGAIGGLRGGRGWKLRGGGGCPGYK